MKRRLLREIALQTLFQMEFSDIPSEQAKAAVLEERELEENVEDTSYVDVLVAGCMEHKAEIDSLIQESAVKWKLERIDTVDRNILRMAIFEMKFLPETLTPNIAINEALEIAKLYAGDNSSKFINGILGNIKNAVQ